MKCGRSQTLSYWEIQSSSGVPSATCSKRCRALAAVPGESFDRPEADTGQRQRFGSFAWHSFGSPQDSERVRCEPPLASHPVRRDLSSSPRAARIFRSHMAFRQAACRHNAPCTFDRGGEVFSAHRGLLLHRVQGASRRVELPDGLPTPGTVWASGRNRWDLTWHRRSHCFREIHPAVRASACVSGPHAAGAGLPAFQLRRG